ncbi:hypothetical protein BGZ83_003269, partial [Gryganskiella cystojenkinii]
MAPTHRTKKKITHTNIPARSGSSVSRNRTRCSTAGQDHNSDTGGGSDGNDSDNEVPEEENLEGKEGKEDSDGKEGEDEDDEWHSSGDGEDNLINQDGAAVEEQQKDPQFVFPDQVSFQLHLRKGQPLVRCRATKDLPKPILILHNVSEDGLSVLCARIRTRINDFNLGLSWPEAVGLYLQPTHTTTQADFLLLDEDDFAGMVKKAWMTEAARVFNKNGEVYVNVYAYVTSPEHAAAIAAATGPASNPISRSTKSKRGDVRKAIVEAKKKGRLDRAGSITDEHLVNHYSKRTPLPTADTIEIPDTNTFTQTMHLDAQRRQEKEKRQ